MGQLMPADKDLSEAAQRRHEMVVCCYESLQHFAYRAQSVHNLKNDQAVIVCIKVDSEWRPLADVLVPDADWQKFRDLGQEPVARGAVQFSMCEIMAMRLPDLAEVLMEKPSEGMYKCIALDEGGCTVYEIVPKEQT